MKPFKILPLILVLMALAGSALAEAPRPGATPPPKPNVLTISTAAKYDFPSPLGTANASFSNSQAAQEPVVYSLQISVAELLKQAGVSGYSEPDYAQLMAQEGFNPETAYVVLCQTEPVAPGQTVETITLGMLPDGTTLPAGDYEARLFETVLETEKANPAQSGADAAAPDSVNIPISMTVSASLNIPFTIQENLIAATADAEGNVSLSVFNPVNSPLDAMYSIQLSQAEIKRVTGADHRTDAELAAQSANPDFNPEYEFISLSQSEPVAPGEFLKTATLTALPDGTPLPKGTYHAWLVKYTLDSTGAQTMNPVNTAIELILP